VKDKWVSVKEVNEYIPRSPMDRSAKLLRPGDKEALDKLLKSLSSVNVVKTSQAQFLAKKQS
jgi:hypothetical protein